MITLSDKAKEKLILLFEEKSLEPNENFIRVSVKGGGCSGLIYELNFDTKSEPEDKQFEDGGFKIVCNKKSFLYLIGTELDFTDGLNGKGFEFRNPNAKRVCGCNLSFSV
jgi:iron-sulfur cluster assembly protein